MRVVYKKLREMKTESSSDDESFGSLAPNQEGKKHKASD